MPPSLNLSPQRCNADIPADPKRRVQRCDVACSCLAGRLLSAMPLILVFDPKPLLLSALKRLLR
jgi:hypothetical protein